VSVPKRTKRAVAILAGGVLLALGVLYFQASREPAGYQPPALTQEQKTAWAKDVLERMAKFHSDAPIEDAYTLALSEEQINAYLACIDEIAYQGEVLFRVGRERGQVDRAMERAGIGGLAVAVGAGGLTLMMRLLRYDKVVSADVSLTMTPDKRLSVHLTAARVGRLAIPKALIRDRLTGLRSALAANAKDTGGSGGSREPRVAGVRVGELRQALGVIVAAIDGEPVQPRWAWQGREVRLERISLRPGRLTLRFSGRKAEKKPR